MVNIQQSSKDLLSCLMLQEKETEFIWEVKGWKGGTKRQCIFFKYLLRRGRSSPLTAPGITWQLLRSTFGAISNCMRCKKMGTH